MEPPVLIDRPVRRIHPRRDPAHFMEEQRGHRSGRPNSAAAESKRRWRSTTYTPSDTRIDQAASFQNVVNAWAKAYIGKDSNAFTVLVGDPNSEHAYQPAAIGTFKT